MKVQSLLFFSGLASALHAPLLKQWQARTGHAQILSSQGTFFEGRSEHNTTNGGNHTFLNEKTKQFAVDGANLPDVDFDIGESYAGSLPISDKKDEKNKLFFWFVPQPDQQKKKTKEIVLWLNGGPGCSSMLGFLQENGPFKWLPGLTKPVKNPWSWHLLSNVVWVDQPVTTGFSTGNTTITNEDELAEQFLGFWKNFMETFSMQGYKVYVAAESYGGMYGPYISSHMLDAKDKKYYDLKGLIVYDGITFDGFVQGNLVVPAFVEEHHDILSMSNPALEKVRALGKKCGFDDYIKKYLVFPPAGPQPKYAPGVSAYPNGTVHYDKECYDTDMLEDVQKQNPCFNIYNIRDQCPQLPDITNGNPSYLDRQDVKKAIHAPLNVKWESCGGNAFVNGDESEPAGLKALPHVIDATYNVIIAEGNLDGVLPPNGNLLGIQNMTWGGKMGFQSAPRDPFYVPYYGIKIKRDDLGRPTAVGYGSELIAGYGVMGTSHHERGLWYVVTEAAGHEGPQYAPTSAFRHLEKLLGRVHSLSDKTPFTLPQLRNITQPEGPLGDGIVKIPCISADCY